MGHRHLGQAAHEQQPDEGANAIADEHTGAGKADGKGAAHEEAGTDGAANGDHGHLGRVQVLLQPGFALLNTVKVGHCSLARAKNRSGKYPANVGQRRGGPCFPEALMQAQRCV